MVIFLNLLDDLIVLRNDSFLVGERHGAVLQGIVRFPKQKFPLEKSKGRVFFYFQRVFMLPIVFQSFVQGCHEKYSYHRTDESPYRRELPAGKEDRFGSAEMELNDLFKK